MREHGFYSAERRRIFNEKPKCTNKAGSFVSAGLIDTYAAFLFFIVGIAVALGIFLIEIMIKSRSVMKIIKLIYEKCWKFQKSINMSLLDSGSNNKEQHKFRLFILLYICMRNIERFLTNDNLF